LLNSRVALCTDCLHNRTMNGQQFGEHLARVVRTYIDRRLGEFGERISALESGKHLRYAGDWDRERQFNEGEIVSHRGALWYTRASTRRPPGKGTSWVKMVAGLKPGVKPSRTRRPHEYCQI
jgi:hypothetical protein